MNATAANSAWLVSSLPAWWRFRRALDDPRRAQDRILQRLIAQNAGCAYGQVYGFTEIRTYQDFQKRVPIVQYDDLAPRIERIQQGEPGVLTTEPVLHLVPTSGSTGGRKLIPFTAGLRREFQGTLGPWMIDLCRQHPAITTGCAYWSISPALPAKEGERSAVPVGFDDDSAYLGGLRQRLVESVLAAPSALRHAPDVETARYLTLLCLLRRRDLALISVWHPSFLTLLLAQMPGCWAELLEEVRSGECRRAAGLRPELQRTMTAQPNVARARELAELDPGQPEAIWPRLKLISCWGDSQASQATAGLRALFPKVAFQPKGLLATEAFVSVPFQGAYPLAVASHFLEFRDAAGDVHLAADLQAGKTYSVIVTTGGGLWRYALGDQVEVTGFLGRTPCVSFLGREGNVSDLRGEKLSEAFVTQSLARAIEAVRKMPAFAMLAPAGDAAGYMLYVEGEMGSPLAARLEQELLENPHYAVCRRLGQLGEVRCFLIQRDAYAAYTRTLITRGMTLGEIKPQALSRESGWDKIFPGRYADT